MRYGCKSLFAGPKEVAVDWGGGNYSLNNSERYV